MTIPRPRPRRTTITVPGDKSITHRALMLAAIAKGRTLIVGPNRGLDVDATIRALRQLGVRVQLKGEDWEIFGCTDFRDPAAVIDCGNSGTTMRLLLGLLAGRPPVALRSREGPLVGIRYALPISSAQVKSALLFAGLRAANPTTITSPDRTRDHSERMLRELGASLSVRGKTITIRRSALRSPGRIRIPGDFSAAVYLLCAAAALPGAALCLRDVGINPTRTAALDILRKMGVQISISKRRVWSGEPLADLTVIGGAPLRGVALPPELVPILIDEIPALCALAAIARSVFSVRHAAELKVKESNRIKTTVELLRSFGADSKALADGIIVRGGATLHAPRCVNTHGDHRIGMAATILAAAVQASVTIENFECIATSFPGFATVWRAAFG